MSKDPYQVLGIKSTATQDEVDTAYFNLRDEYRETLFLDGQAGRDGAKKLNEVEDAYRAILSDRAGNTDPIIVEESAHDSSIDTEDAPFTTSSSYADIEAMIKAGNLRDAQKALDDTQLRDAEWHFWQSNVFYKKGRIAESRSQLQTACNMDPGNTKYRDVLAKLDDIEAKQKDNAGFNQTTQNGMHRSYGNDRYDAGASDEACCRACQAAMCINCLCDCCCRG